MRWALAVLLLSPTLSRADDLRLLGGKVLSGKTTEITEAGIKMKADGKEIATPLEQILALELRPVKGLLASTKYSAARLIDDTVLNCQEKGIAFAGKEVELTLLSGAKFKLPLSYITWVVRDANDAELMKKWDRLVKDKVRADRLIVLKDGELNPLEGTLGAVDEKNQTIDFTQGTEKIAAKLEKAHGLIFFRPDAAAKEPLCRVFDSQGNVLTATSLKLVKDAFELKTTFGASIDLKEEAVARIDFNMGKLMFLSDLEPSRVVEKSRIGLAEPYRRDANLDGQPIQLDQAYAKGLSLHAHTELEYPLQGKFKEFKAVLGVDSRVGTASHAKVTIICDGTEKFSDTVSGKVRPIVVDVKGVTTLRIIVSSPDFFGLGDHATLADAQVRK
ncbi:MAG: NPCBM/NEW2 domain-containing protein [Gemmataceae bacterium]